MNIGAIGTLFALSILAGMLLSIEIGFRLGRLHQKKNLEEKPSGFGAVEGAVFGLMGLLVAFSFSGAAARFDSRRQLIVEEANAIGTAYLRLDLLPPDTQPNLREDFCRYLDTRLAAYEAFPDLEAVKNKLEESARVQARIWSQAIKATQEAQNPAVTSLVIPALNQMIDITTTRTMVLKTHPPLVIYMMLAIAALASAVLAGYGMAVRETRSWIHVLGFAALMAITIYVIMDLEYPRVGLIRIDDFDHVLVDLRKSMNEGP